MSGQFIRERFMRRFVGMSKYSRLTAWLLVLSYLAQVVAGIVAGHYMVSLPLSGVNVPLMVLISVFIATRLRGLNNIVHECTHSTFSEHRGDNLLLGRLCASILAKCFEDYKDDHLSHHAHLGDYEHDRELGIIEKFRLHDPLTVSTIFRHVATPLLGRHLMTYSGVNMSARDGAAFLWLKILLLFSIGIFTLFAPYTAIFFVLLPLFYTFPTLNFWTDCLDHAGLVGADDELNASRNVLAPLPLRLLFFPRNDCYHLVHHLFPQVPARHLDAAHEQLIQDPSYRNAPHGIRPIRNAVVAVAPNVS